MNVSFDSGSALAVLAAVAMTSIFAFAIVALYLSHQRKQASIDHARPDRTARVQDRESESLKEILAVTWLLEDVVGAADLVNGSVSAQLMTMVSPQSLGSDALIELSMNPRTRDVGEAFRQLRRTIYAMNQSPHGESSGSPTLAEVREQIRVIERLARTRLEE